MKYPFDRSGRGPEDWAKSNTALRKTRDDIIAGRFTAQELRVFCERAAADALPLQRNKDWLLWYYDDPNTMPSDVRCEFVYLPTYLMAQCLIAAALQYPELMESEAIRDALHRGLNGCTGRELCGHGYDAESVQYENLLMFLEAGYGAFTIRYPQISPEFRALFQNALTGVRDDYAAGRHVFGWSCDLKAQQEAILKAIRGQIPGDLACDDSHRLYIAYGSNMDEAQMADRCPDAVLVGVGTLQDHRLIFHRYATVEENPGTDVPVALWKISAADERTLDRYEGVPTFYCRAAATVTLNTGETAEGLIYLMEKHRMDPVPENYYRRIAQAYLRLGLGCRIADALEPAKARSQIKGDA